MNWTVVFDPRGRKAADMKVARSGHGCSVLDADTVLVSGGAHSESGSALASAEIYSLNTDTWTPTYSMDQERCSGG